MCTLQSVVKLASKELALLLPNKLPAQKSDGQVHQFYESHIRDVIFWAIDKTGFFTYQCVVYLNFGRNVWRCVWSVFRSNQTLESGAGELAKVVKSFVRGSVRCTSDKPRLTTSDNNQEGSIKAVA